MDIVRRRVDDLGRALELPTETPALAEIRRVVTIFRELREGKMGDGKTKVKSPSSTLSTALNRMCDGCTAGKVGETVLDGEGRTLSIVAIDGAPEGSNDSCSGIETGLQGALHPA